MPAECELMESLRKILREHVLELIIRPAAGHGPALAVPVPIGGAPPAAPLVPAGRDLRVFNDYRICILGDLPPFDLSPTQAAIVRVLHQALLRGQPDMTGDEIWAELDPDVASKRIDNWFRSKGKFVAAWGRLVVHCGRRRYRLNVAAPGRKDGGE